MKMKFNHIKQQTQDFLLRLFMDPSEAGSTPSYTHYYYTCGHVGTHARVHQ